MEVFSVIMAGGEEMRFGPVGRYVGSKKFLQIGGSKEILLETMRRCSLIANKKNIYIVTNETQQKIIDQKLQSDDDISNFKNYIIEPAPKGTAFCILLAALQLKYKFPNKKGIVMCVFPSDHDIPKHDDAVFKKTLKKAIKVASEYKKLVLVGIKLDFPATAYGYINYANELTNSAYHHVKEFKEKPEKPEAISYYEKKDEYFWNSGIFVWDLDVILQQFENLMKDEYYSFKNLYEENSNFTRAFYKLQKIYNSKKQKVFVDKAILEKASNESIVVVRGDFEWHDIGKWDALLALYSNADNIYDVDIIGVDKTNHTIYSTGKHIYRNDPKFTFNSPDNSYVWLYCDDKDRDEILKVLEQYELYNFSNFHSKQIESTREMLLKSKENSDSLSAVPTPPHDAIIDKMDNEACREFEKDVFISHCYADKDLAEALASLLLEAGIERNRVFCSSIPGQGASPGDNLPDEIRKYLLSSRVVVFMLSAGYYGSSFCLNEMGASWVLNKESMPMLIPPFPPDKMTGFIDKNHLAAKIDSSSDMDLFYIELSRHLNLTSVDMPIWNRAKETFLTRVKAILANPKRHTTD